MSDYVSNKRNKVKSTEKKPVRKDKEKDDKRKGTRVSEKKGGRQKDKLREWSKREEREG